MKGQRSSTAKQPVKRKARIPVAESLHRRVEELAELQATVLDITVPHDLPDLLRTIVERATRLLEAKGGGLYLCDAASRECRLEVTFQTPRDYSGTVLKYGEGVAGTIAESGKPLIIDDYRKWPGRAPVFDRDKPFRAVLGVPMIWQGQVIGVIDVLRDSDGHTFTPEDQELLTMFANHAAIATANARLLRGIQEELKERKKIQRAISESELKYQTLFNAANDAILLVDGDCFVDCNSKAIELFGMAKERILGSTPLALSPPRQPDGSSSKKEIVSRIKATIGGEAQFFEWQHLRGRWHAA